MIENIRPGFIREDGETYRKTQTIHLDDGGMVKMVDARRILALRFYELEGWQRIGEGMFENDSFIAFRADRRQVVTDTASTGVLKPLLGSGRSR